MNTRSAEARESDGKADGKSVWRRRTAGPGQHAFSLMEVVVVMAIIAVLMGIWVVGLRIARQEARQIRARSDQRQHEIARRADGLEDR